MLSNVYHIVRNRSQNVTLATFNSYMSDFKPFERGTKIQDHEGTK